jgi:hypothetical protein
MIVGSVWSCDFYHAIYNSVFLEVAIDSNDNPPSLIGASRDRCILGSLTDYRG